MFGRDGKTDDIYYDLLKSKSKEFQHELTVSKIEILKGIFIIWDSGKLFWGTEAVTIECC